MLPLEFDVTLFYGTCTVLVGTVVSVPVPPHTYIIYTFEHTGTKRIQNRILKPHYGSGIRMIRKTLATSVVDPEPAGSEIICRIRSRIPNY